jgi:polyhydroxyalkanoate synthase
MSACQDVINRSRYKTASDHYVDPATWSALAPQKQGSWWPQWVTWLAARSGNPVGPPDLGAADASLATVDAPGSYVLQE